MHLQRLSLRRFRNLGVQDLEFPPEGVAIVGDNAQGKSNLLEAIYYLETLRSFRGAPDMQLVEFGSDVFRLVGHLGGTGVSVEVSAAFQKKGKRKKVTMGGVEPDRLSDALGSLSAVVFSPSDVELVSGGPGDRRRFLDILLSLNEHGYLLALQDYRKVVARRNALLKDDQAAELIAAFDHGLIRTGARIMLSRLRWIENRREAFCHYYSTVSGGSRASMSYRPSFALGPAGSLDDVADAFREAIASTRDRERRVGSTVVGPHRDDVRLRLGDEGEDLDLRDFGSGGQRRTAALALRMVEARTVRESRGEEPIVLLDDVFAELDEGRSERVLDLMEREETGQVVLTAPKDADVRVRSDSLPRWRIRDGMIAS